MDIDVRVKSESYSYDDLRSLCSYSLTFHIIDRCKPYRRLLVTFKQPYAYAQLSSAYDIDIDTLVYSDTQKELHEYVYAHQHEIIGKFFDPEPAHYVERMQGWRCTDDGGKGLCITIPHEPF